MSGNERGARTLSCRADSCRRSGPGGIVSLNSARLSRSRPWRTLGSVAGQALAALRFNKQRSLLTMLSLAWGVVCFVILYSYGDGFQVALRTAFRAVGQDLILMFEGST